MGSVPWNTSNTYQSVLLLWHIIFIYILKMSFKAKHKMTSWLINKSSNSSTFPYLTYYESNHVVSHNEPFDLFEWIYACPSENREEDHMLWLQKHRRYFYFIFLIGPRAPSEQGPCQSPFVPLHPSWQLAQRTSFKMINRYLYYNKYLLAPVALWWLYILFLMLNKKLEIGPRSRLRFFSPFFREKKEMNHRYKYWLFNHMLISKAHLYFWNNVKRKA